jgi:protein gp37
VGLGTGRYRGAVLVDSITATTDAQGVAAFYKQRREGNKKVSLPMLDGRQWAEYPEVSNG